MSAPVEQLKRKFGELKLRLSVLQGRAAELQARKSALVRSIGLAKARQELAPAATEALEYLQERAHQEAVGEFEDLLSAFVADVVPDAGRISLELGTERGAPALDILVNNGGDIESVLEGNGGALTNVVVTGLGYSALARTRNRPFMVLDEPDCWLKVNNVPAFTRVIAEVANPRVLPDGTAHEGCQTLMISHNDISLMDDSAHIQDLRIERDVERFAARHGVKVVYVGEKTACAYVVWVPGTGRRAGTIEVRYRKEVDSDPENNALTKGFPYVESIGGARAWDTCEQTGIRWVEATNLRSHVKTRIELSSGLNVLTGSVNAGKSNLYFTCFRAMAYGESDDVMLRHGADQLIIRMGLENEVELEMVRTRTGSPKVMYRRYAHGLLTHEGRPEKRGTVPAFIADALNIRTVDGLDIQLRSQKQPVFLLNEPASRRAQLLSVGRESGLLQALIEQHRLQMRRDSALLKEEEAELSAINRKLLVLDPAASLVALTELMDASIEDVKAKATVLDHLSATTKRLAELSAMNVVAAFAEPTLRRPLAGPGTKSTVELTTSIAQLTRLDGILVLPDLPAVLDRPTLKDATPLRAAIAALSSGGAWGVIADALPASMQGPKLVDTQPLRQAGMSIASAAAAIQAHEKDAAAIEAEVTQANQALAQLKAELRVCPTCHEPFNRNTHTHHASLNETP